METLIFLCVGVGIGIIKCTISKRNGKTTKLRYYNYRKYAIKYKKINNSLNEESKITF